MPVNEEMELLILTPSERKYTHRQSGQLEVQTGSIGFLRGYFDTSKECFESTWFDGRKYWKTEEFQAALDKIIHSLWGKKGILCGSQKMGAFVKEHPESISNEECNRECGFRVNTEKYAFLFRCGPNPIKGDYNFYCYCYVKEYIDRHIRKAERGIRFIDSRYNDMFRLPDGEKIVVTAESGKKSEYICRFIDECHTEVGTNFYHISEFAERMEQRGATYEPKSTENPPARKPPKNRDYER